MYACTYSYLLGIYLVIDCFIPLCVFSLTYLHCYNTAIRVYCSIFFYSSSMFCFRLLVRRRHQYVRSSGAPTGRRRRGCDDTRTPATPAHCLHEHTTAGAGERIPLQQVPLSAATDRDRSVSRPNRASGESMVPKPPHEVQTSDATEIIGRRCHVGRRRNRLSGRRQHHAIR